MKAITISIVQNGFLVQGYPPRNYMNPFEPPLAEFLYVFNNIEDLQKQLPDILKVEILPLQKHELSYCGKTPIN